MFVCPNCSVPLQQNAKACSRCDAIFGPESAWAPVHKKVEPTKPWVPNEISAWNRGWYVVFIILGTAYASYGIFAGELYVPGKRGSGFTVHGPGAWVMAAAVLVGVANLVGRVLDHYDRRSNERSYRLFDSFTSLAFFALFTLALCTKK